MKKLLIVLAIAGAFASCNNSAETTGERKDSIDSIANEKKEAIDSTADQNKEAVDSLSDAKKENIEAMDSLNHQ
jgi:hypothetical protein